MRHWVVLCLAMIANCALASNWEIDQTMRIEADGEKPKDFEVKYLLTGQKLWRSIKPKGAKDNSQTIYAIFDSVRFHHCETVNSKGTCTVSTVSVFDSILSWAHSYQMDFKVKRINFKNNGKTVKILDQNADCFTSVIAGQVGGSATNSYRVIRTGYGCFAKNIDMDALASQMVKKMKTIKNYIDGENLAKYEKMIGLGIPLKESVTINSRGVGPFGVGKARVTIQTTAISDKRLDLSRLKLPDGFEAVDMTDQLQDVSIKPGKK
jgi:hypothetical protein